jgi:hypothetical protein
MARVKKCPVCGVHNKPNALFCTNDRTSLQNVSPISEEELADKHDLPEAEVAESTQEQLCPNPSCQQPIKLERSHCVYCNTPLEGKQPTTSLTGSTIFIIASLTLEISGHLFEVDECIVFGRDESISPIASLIPRQLDNVSRRHAEIWVKDNKAYIKDFNSTNGTFVNGRRIQSITAVQIEDGDSIRFAADLNVNVRICYV